MANHAEDAKMLLDIPSSVNNVINDHLILNLVDIYIDNTLQILYNHFYALPKLENSQLENHQNLSSKVWNVQLQNSISCSVVTVFRQSWSQNLRLGMLYSK